MRRALKEFAEAPGAYLGSPPGAHVLDERRFHAIVSSNGRWIGVSRLSIDASEAADVFATVHAMAPTAIASWVIADPCDEVVRALRHVGCRDPEPPLLPEFTALATDREPPAAEGIEVRKVSSFADFLLGLEVVLAEGWPEDAAAKQRAEAEQTYARRRVRPGGEWLASIDGRVVAWAGAVACPRGLFLSGGATHPDARGRGCYRALVHARWHESVHRGTPGLVVHAQETSRPILERVGFERVCAMAELESGPFA